MKARMDFFPMDKLIRRDELSKDYEINANSYKLSLDRSSVK